MAGIGPTDLHGLAREFLEACEQALDTIPTYDATLAGAPDRVFVSYGPVIALDCCDQLTVHVGTLTEGDSAPFPPKASVARINHVTLVATFARCVPVPDSQGNPPAPATQEAAAEQINADKWAIWNHIYNLVNADVLFDKCCDVLWFGLTALQENGGCGGSSLTLAVCFDGYEEVLGT